MREIIFFIKNSSLLWAILMCIGWLVVWSLILRLFNTTDFFVILSLICLIVFTLKKKITSYTYVILLMLFISTYFLIILISEKNINILDTHINFLIVKVWYEDGYSPPEEIISNDFLSFILLNINLLFIFLLNILSDEYFRNRKINYCLVLTLFITIILNIVI